jgi:hypothetical protein
MGGRGKRWRKRIPYEKMPFSSAMQFASTITARDAREANYHSPSITEHRFMAHSLCNFRMTLS